MIKRITIAVFASLLSIPALASDCALRQSTASQELLLGPFVDSTDGVTAETALTIANTDIGRGDARRDWEIPNCS